MEVLLLLLLLGESGARPKPKPQTQLTDPVNMKTKFKTKFCLDRNKAKFREKKSFENDCFKYTCTKKGKKFLVWKKTELSSKCCFLDSTGFSHNSIISNITLEPECLLEISTCRVESSGPVVVRHTQPHCCFFSGQKFPVGEDITSPESCLHLRCVMVDNQPSIQVVEKETTTGQTTSTLPINTPSTPSTTTISPTTPSEVQTTSVMSTLIEDCLTEKGEPCVFPFKDGNTEYHECALYRNRAWCATTVNDARHYVKYGWCDVNTCKGTTSAMTKTTISTTTVVLSTTSDPTLATTTTTLQSTSKTPAATSSTITTTEEPTQPKATTTIPSKKPATHQITTQSTTTMTTTIISTPSEPQGCMTTKGEKCLFPFIEGSVEYHECAVYRNRPWCATTVNDAGHYVKFGYCDVATCTKTTPVMPTTTTMFVTTSTTSETASTTTIAATTSVMTTTISATTAEAITDPDTATTTPRATTLMETSTSTTLPQTSSCTTDKDQPCVFPYVDDFGASVSWCSKYRTKFWCATSLLPSGKYDKWGYCKDTCPLGPPTTTTTTTTSTTITTTTEETTTKFTTLTTETTSTLPPKSTKLIYIMYRNTSLTLDFLNSSLLVTELDKLQHQKWKFDTGYLLNSAYGGKALGIVKDTCCTLTLVDMDSQEALTWFLKDGSLINIKTKGSLHVDENNLVILTPSSLLSRQAMGPLQEWTTQAAEPVGCPELTNSADAWPPFEEFENHNKFPECWDDVLPTFRLFTRLAPEPCVLVDSSNQLFNIQTCTTATLSRLVIIIHGWRSNADPAEAGNWPTEMAELVLENDNSTDGAVTVDWKEGASSKWTSPYGQAAANTQYVGVATERVVKQLGGCSLTVHCIGHSLGAHTCGFLGQAVTQDMGCNIARITAMDPAGPDFTTELRTNPELLAIRPPAQRLDSTDADYVDVLHTDGDHSGTMVDLGDVDFYIGKSQNHLGKDQAGCIDPICDHGRSHELLRASLRHKESCWATHLCSLTETFSLAPCVDEFTPRPQFGYFQQGKPSNGGVYGVELTLTEDPFCFRCVEASQCEEGEICDTTSLAHECIPEVCPSGSEENCEEKSSSQAPSATCSSEPDARCSSEGGYCIKVSNCPNGDYLDNKCPGDNTVKCCLSAPFQEPECDSEGGSCVGECSCEGDLLSGFCPTQPGPIKCCVAVEEVENCEGNTETGSCVEEKKRRKRSTCSSEPSAECAAESGHCGNPDVCPGNDVINNKCPGGQDNKCCLSMPFQEPECEAEGGSCVDKCNCSDDNMLHGFCPSQPDSVKCCETSEGTTPAGGMTTEEATEACQAETTISQCLEENKRKKRSTGCSSEPSETCAAESGHCGNPDVCPGNDVIDNKCPGGQDNKCCLSMPFQEPECEAEGGSCVDKCTCSDDSMLHGFCPSQPNSVKCCKASQTTTPAGTTVSGSEGGTTAAAVEGCVTATTPLACSGGFNTNCNNGVCTTTCSGGGNNNNNNNGGAGGNAGGGADGGGAEGGAEGGTGGAGGGAGGTGGTDTGGAGGGGGGGLSCPGGYNTNCNNGVCTVTCSGGGGNNNNNNNNNNGRKRRRKRSTGEMCPLEPATTTTNDPCSFTGWRSLDLGNTCACWTEADSQAAAAGDLARIQEYAASITAASVAHCIPEAIIMGIISRESAGGATLGLGNNEPGWGDNNNGFGLMQVDIGTWTPESETDIDNIDQGTSILAGLLTQVQNDQTGPAPVPGDWSSVWQLRGAVAAYNFGADDVWTQAGVDGGTSSTCSPCDGNYSWDTINRAKWFADNA